VPYALPAVCLDISSAEAQLGQDHATGGKAAWPSDISCVIAQATARKFSVYPHWESETLPHGGPTCSTSDADLDQRDLYIRHSFCSL